MTLDVERNCGSSSLSFNKGCGNNDKILLMPMPILKGSKSGSAREHEGD